MNGNLLISDTGNDDLKMVAGATQIIRKMAGIGIAGYNGGNPGVAITNKLYNPWAVYVASVRGRMQIYISDTANNRVRMLTLQAEPRLY
jgi:hypothetical protein